MKKTLVPLRSDVKVLIIRFNPSILNTLKIYFVVQCSTTTNNNWVRILVFTANFREPSGKCFFNDFYGLVIVYTKTFSLWKGRKITIEAL